MSNFTRFVQQSLAAVVLRTLMVPAMLLAPGFLPALAYGQGSGTTELQVAGLKCPQGTFWATSWGLAGTELTVNKTFDGCTPVLYESVAAGAHFSDMILTHFDANNRATVVLSFSQITVNSLQLVNGHETVEFNFASMSVQNVAPGLSETSEQDPAQDSSKQVSAALQLPACAFSASSWTLLVTMPIATKASAGEGVHSADFGPLTIAKVFDSCSKYFPQLLNGAGVSRLTLTQNDAANRPLIRIDLTDVKMTNYSAQSKSNSETIAFSYRTITIANVQTGSTQKYGF